MKLEFYDGTKWISVVTSVAITGSTGLSVANSPITSSGNITLTLGAELQALSGLNTNGLVARKSTSSYSPVTITGTSGQINVSNGDGIAGNPIISLSTTGVSSGNYTKLNGTVDIYGRLTSISNGDTNINSGTTGQLDISRVNGYPNDQYKTLLGSGIWDYIRYVPLNSLQAYPNNWQRIPCGDGNWRTIVETTPDNSFPIYKLSNYPNNSAYFLRGDGLWDLIQNSGITSVGITGSAGLSISGSPLTSPGGTININLSNALQAFSNLNAAGILITRGNADYGSIMLTSGTGISITNPAGTTGNPEISVSTIDINSNTTGQLNISRLAGYSNHRNLYLRGDGTWSNPLHYDSDANRDIGIVLDTTATLSSALGMAILNNGFKKAQFTFDNLMDTANIISNNVQINANTTASILGNNIVLRTANLERMEIMDYGDISFKGNTLVNYTLAHVVHLNGYYLRPDVGNAYDDHLILKHSISPMTNQSGIGAGPYSAVLYGGTNGTIAEFFYGTTRQAYVSTGGSWVNSSDKEYKHSIRKKEHKNYLERILKLPIYSYCFKQDDMDTHQANQVSIGVTYQDVEKIFNGNALSKPKMHEQFLCEDESCKFCYPDSKGVCYSDIFLYHILAFKEFYENEYLPLKKAVFLEN